MKKQKAKARRLPRNKFEKKVWDQLVEADIKFDYEPQAFPYIIEARYWPDFYIKRTKIYVELKGYFRPEDKRKLKSFKKSNPKIDIRIVFMKANDNYIRWAEKNGFPWAESSIPKEWL